MSNYGNKFAMLLCGILTMAGCGQQQDSAKPAADPSMDRASVVTLSDEELENLVRRSYQYVAMFNVSNKTALDADNPMTTGGYNRVKVNDTLVDHHVEMIARPNNDTLYAGAMIDVTEEPMVLKLPAFDSTYVSLQVSAYDHYTSIPLSTRQGDFNEPSTILFYSERTPGYDGTPVNGVDKIFEASGDFVITVTRVMPHAAEPQRLESNLAAMRSITLQPLSEFLGEAVGDPEFLSWGSPPAVPRNLTLKEDLMRFPAFGSDMEIFEDRLLEVMQFVFNHTTFDPDNEMDAAVLAIYEPLGVTPGKTFDPETTAELDGAAVRAAAERVATDSVRAMSVPSFVEANGTRLFLPKGEIDLDIMVLLSVVGPIGLPATEAVYPALSTEDGAPMNAMFDYEIVMAPEDMPPAMAFWSTTLYDSANGFFIPNDHFKYSVGENGGFELDADGGIRIVIAEKQPEGVPDENWLPINRGDYDVDIIMRLYAPDLEKFANWSPPVVRKLQ